MKQQQLNRIRKKVETNIHTTFTNATKNHKKREKPQKYINNKKDSQKKKDQHKIETSNNKQNNCSPAHPKMNTKQRENVNGRNGSSRLTSTMPNANYVHRKNACTRNDGVRQHFFNSTVAIALFAMIMIVNVRLSCGLIDMQAEKEKHGKFDNITKIDVHSYNNAMNMISEKGAGKSGEQGELQKST